MSALRKVATAGSEVVELTARAEVERRLIGTMRHHLGNVICERLDDLQVIEVMLNEDGTVWEDRLGVGMAQIGSMRPPAALSFISTVASFLRTTCNRDQPILEGELPIRGARFEALVPPLAPNPLFCIRLKAVRVFSMDDYVESGVMTLKQRALIREAVLNRENMLIAGGVSTGKTTLGNAILQEVSTLTGEHRVVILEDTVELQCEAKNKVQLRTSNNVSIQRLLMCTMRLRPDRIIVGEVRDGSALFMLKAWNTGHPGGLCTVHANSAQAALTRIEQLISEASATPMRAVIAEAVNLVIPIVKIGLVRRINPIMRVNGLLDNGDYNLTTVE